MSEEKPVTVKDVEEAARKEAPKICFMCEANEAKFCIKDQPKDSYCQECAKNAFGDTSYLEKL
ncbi:hypothetical protein GOV08_00895 [Candidatus Woesearchaeota archaeon]|nr:hypothetical protein [Candidatus Woesearchaeota archaeon]